MARHPRLVVPGAIPHEAMNLGPNCLPEGRTKP